MVRNIFKSVFFLSLILILSFQPLLAQEADFDVKAKSAILIEYETGEVLYQKNAEEELPPASMTKIMTMLLLMEALEEGRVKLEDKLVCSEFAASMGGSQIWLEPGEEMSLEDLMKAIAIVSANDASVVVAEYLYGTEEAFVRRMNERARELGLKNSYFYNTNGLPPDNPDVQGTYTSARDLSILARELIKHKKVLEWTSTWIDYLRNGKSVLNNTNRLVRFYPGADGIKTGYTQEAQYCLTSTAERDGLRFIAVVMGVEDSVTRFEESRKLLDYGFTLFQPFVVAEEKEVLEIINIPNGKEEQAKGIVEEEIIVPVRRDREEEIRRVIEIEKRISAPLKKGDKIGTVKVYRGNLLLKTADLVIDQDVEKASFFQIFRRIIRYQINSLTALIS
ncbi:MAG: D-alanyl-D-alanine carboxypeptidase family protein [Halanaerobiales bacterium]|jgi:D-alanyl-D-alanine carboxypeptidase (penicillin-binding protein 5/6)|nr:D-alanyl-D-alanine carboxypeptidase family protein [Halanaerobiales bacterium]HPZ62309.1 D-alanyl-D-alanine carboxypeptidase family protein [Halanaerobiales bacterium]HQD03215.1 D-alanyl-D-alanine carboxypeptidase family protein [Halanaerobiales bacterium]